MAHPPDSPAKDRLPKDGTLTDFRYGGHSGTEKDDARDDPNREGPPGAAEPTPDGSPVAYVPTRGERAPDGVEQFGMYGVANEPASAAAASASPAPARPPDTPAVSGLQAGQSTPTSHAQILGTVEERLAGIVDPGRVGASLDGGTLTLRGTLRDASMRDAVEACARGCPGVTALRTEWTLDSD
jgi:hypothetical protein